MRKVVIVLVVAFCSVVLTSCTNDSDELNERIEYEEFLIEKSRVTAPNGGSTGGTDYDKE